MIGVFCNRILNDIPEEKLDEKDHYFIEPGVFAGDVGRLGCVQQRRTAAAPGPRPGRASPGRRARSDAAAGAGSARRDGRCD
jgi:hypothetical protein